MTMAEKKVESILKEIEKIEKSLSRYQGILEKKVAKAEKLNCKWTREEFFEHRDTDMTDEQWMAYFEMGIAEGNVVDTQERIENAFKRLEKAESELEKVAEQIEEDKEIEEKELKWLKMRQKREEAYYKWLEEFKASCLEDGIVIEKVEMHYISGQMRNGKHFILIDNDGFTIRSRHCYTLKIEGNTIFTSGLFGTAYKYIKR